MSCELSAWQTIHMNCQVLFSLKCNQKKKKKIECRLLKFCFASKGNQFGIKI